MKVPTLREVAPVASGFVVGAAIGALVGLYGVRAAHMYSSMMNSMGTNFTLSTRAHTQYCNADYDGARAALLAWLRHLDTQKPPSDPPRLDDDPLMTPHFIAADKTIVFGKLAMLEERHGDSERAKEYWTQAGHSAKVAQWRDYSEVKIRAFVDDPKYCKGSETTTGPKAEGPKP